MKKIFLICSSLFLFIACQKDESGNVNQDSIYTIYELFYNNSTDKTTAQATFRFGGAGGTLLDLTDPASVTFNGDDLQYRQVLGVHNKEYAGLVSSGTFVYEDLDNNVFTNSTASIEMINFPPIDTISNANAITFQWIGNPVGVDETVTLTVDGAQQTNFEIFATSAVGATELILDANKLQNPGIGNASATLIRTKNRSSVDQGTSEGGRMAVWYTAATNFYIKN